MKKLLLCVGILSSLYGCSAKRQIQSFNEVPKEVCIMKHDAVKRPEFLAGMQDGFKARGTDVRMIKGVYVNENNMWVPHLITGTYEDCDDIVAYVANWRWDGVMYLQFANIWVLDGAYDFKSISARSTYEISGLSGLSLGKFVDSHDKAVEMVGELYN